MCFCCPLRPRCFHACSVVGVRPWLLSALPTCFVFRLECRLFSSGVSPPVLLGLMMPFLFALWVAPPHHKTTGDRHQRAEPERGRRRGGNGRYPGGERLDTCYTLLPPIAGSSVSLWCLGPCFSPLRVPARRPVLFCEGSVPSGLLRPGSLAEAASATSA